MPERAEMMTDHDRRDDVRDQGELERARDWHHEKRTNAEPGTRAWRTDHTEVALVQADEEPEQVYLRVTDITTGRYTQAPLCADDLEIVAHILQLHAARLRRAEDRR